VHRGVARVTTNSFRTPKFVDHIIEDDDRRVVGTIRVKPSGVAWAPADGKKWRRVTLEKFIQFSGFGSPACGGRRGSASSPAA
jgi:hypothetical protein